MSTLGETGQHEYHIYVTFVYIFMSNQQTGNAMQNMEGRHVIHHQRSHFLTLTPCLYIYNLACLILSHVKFGFCFFLQNLPEKDPSPTAGGM